jgi:GT2 family glycosyltransferase
MSNETVSVIVVYRKLDYIEACLASLRGQAGEVIVIDNSLDLGSSALLRDRNPGVRWFSQEKNLSYCDALNFGIRHSSGDFVLCLNDDVLLAQDYVARCLEAFSRGPRIGMVSGKIMREDKKTIDSTGLFVSLFYTAHERGYGKKDAGQFDRDGFIFGVTGAAGFYRRQMLEDLREGENYFDPVFRYFYEDLDMAWRGQRRGWKGCYAFLAGAVHVRGGTTRQKSGIGRRWARRFLSDELYCDLFKNRYLVISKNASALGLLGHLFLVILHDVAAWLHVLFFRPRLVRVCLAAFRPCKKP